MERIPKPELKLALSKTLIDRGCVNFIGLELIKAAAGNRWQKSRPSVIAQLEAILRRTLGPTDFFAEIDDTNFFVCTPAATGEESRIVCLRAAYELHTSQLGECDLNVLRIAQITSVTDDCLEYTTMQPDAIMHLAARAGLPVSGGAEGWDKVFFAESAPKKAHAAPQVQFTPLWDVQHEAITTYRCDVPVEQLSLGLPSQRLRMRDELAALLSRLTITTNALSRHLSVGERFLLSIPISYELLGSPVVRMEVTSFCRALSSTLRSYLLFEISELPYGVPQSRLSELVGSLRPFCRGVSAILPARIPSYGAYQGSNLFAIGLSLAPHFVGTTEMESEIFKLSSAAKRLHMKSIALDVPNVETLLGARGHGVSLISGPPIGSPVPEPSPIRRLTLDQIVIQSATGFSRLRPAAHAAA